jgi:uncharacterized protein YggE
VTRELPPVSEVLDGAVKELLGASTDVELNSKEMEAVVRDAVKAAVEEAVKGAVEEAVEDEGADAHILAPIPIRGDREGAA